MLLELFDHDFSGIRHLRPLYLVNIRSHCTDLVPQVDIFLLQNLNLVFSLRDCALKRCYSLLELVQLVLLVLILFGQDGVLRLYLCDVPLRFWVRSVVLLRLLVHQNLI